MTTLAAQIQAINERIVLNDGSQVRNGNGRRTREPLVKRPGTAGDREISGCVVNGRYEREPWRQFVCVVTDEERAGLEIGYGAGSVLRHGLDVLRRIDRVNVQGGARVFGIVTPGGTRPEVDAVAMVALGDENVCEEAVSASVGRYACEMGKASDSYIGRTQGPRTHQAAATSACRVHRAQVYDNDFHHPLNAALHPRKTVSKEA